LDSLNPDTPEAKERVSHVRLRKKLETDRASTPAPLKLKKGYYRLGNVRLSKKS
jgi:hypothetical protein